MNKHPITSEQEVFAIDIVYDGALFTQPICEEAWDWEGELLEAEIERLKRLIEKTATDWDSQCNNGQLSLDLGV